MLMAGGRAQGVKKKRAGPGGRTRAHSLSIDRPSLYLPSLPGHPHTVTPPLITLHSRRPSQKPGQGQHRPPAPFSGHDRSRARTSLPRLDTALSIVSPAAESLELRSGSGVNFLLISFRVPSSPSQGHHRSDAADHRFPERRSSLTNPSPYDVRSLSVTIDDARIVGSVSLPCRRGHPPRHTAA
jgi:hypothetical protein